MWQANGSESARDVCVRLKLAWLAIHLKSPWDMTGIHSDVARGTMDAWPLPQPQLVIPRPTSRRDGGDASRCR